LCLDLIVILFRSFLGIKAFSVSSVILLPKRLFDTLSLNPLHSSYLFLTIVLLLSLSLDAYDSLDYSLLGISRFDKLLLAIWSDQGELVNELIVASVEIGELNISLVSKLFGFPKEYFESWSRLFLRLLFELSKSA